MEKKSFFKKVRYSIDKIEKYSELSAEGFTRAIKYLAVLIIILPSSSVAVGSTVVPSHVSVATVGSAANTPNGNAITKIAIDKTIAKIFFTIIPPLEIFN